VKKFLIKKNEGGNERGWDKIKPDSPQSEDRTLKALRNQRRKREASATKDRDPLTVP